MRELTWLAIGLAFAACGSHSSSGPVTEQGGVHDASLEDEDSGTPADEPSNAAGAGGVVATGAAGHQVGGSSGSTMPPPSSSKAGFIPYIDGTYKLVYVPTNMRYLNDHTIAKGPDDVWHVIGITNTGTGDPQTERSFLHAVADALLGDWAEKPDALTALDSEKIIWAPHIVQVEDDWTMVFYSEPMQSGAGSLHRATSADLNTWTRVDELSPAGGRDPFLMREGDHWLLYSVGVRDSHGQIVVSTTRGSDLKDWSPASPVTEDPVQSFGWGNLESPTVVKYAGSYYLFLTRTDENSATDYNRTYVFRSDDPIKFDWSPITELRAHAAEIVIDGDAYYITSCGWPDMIGDINRGLSIARLGWTK